MLYSCHTHFLTVSDCTVDREFRILAYAIVRYCSRKRLILDPGGY
jgi:hypothetical protein